MSDQEDFISRESSPGEPPSKETLERRKLEKWMRVGQYGGVGLAEKARKRLRAIALKNNPKPSNPPATEPAAEIPPPPPKQQAAPRPQTAPNKIVKPAARPAARPTTRHATLEDGNAARAIAALRQDQRRKLPPKEKFTARHPCAKRVMPIPIHTPLQPRLTHPLPPRPHSPPRQSYIPGVQRPVGGMGVCTNTVANPLRLSPRDRAMELMRLHEQYRQTGAIDGLPLSVPRYQQGGSFAGWRQY